MTNLFIDVFAELDVILIAIMLSGIFVKVGQGRGKTFWDYHYKSFYVLFTVFIIENILVTIFANFIFLPFLEKVLPNNYWKVASLTVTLVLASSVWFANAFGFKPHWEMIIACIGMAITTLLLFAYT